MKIFYLLFLILPSVNVLGQEVIFSPVIAKDNEANYFQYNIIGKVGENYCIQKRHARSDNMLAFYDANMRLVSNNRLKMLPANAAVFGTINYNDHLLLIYKYRTRNAVYLKAIRFDQYGLQLNEPITLDETRLIMPISIEDYPSPADDIQYFISLSENMQYILISKRIKDDATLRVSSKLWTSSLNLIKQHDFNLPVNNKTEVCTLPLIDNSGTFIFTRSTVSADDLLVTKLELISKSLIDDSLKIIPVQLAGFNIAELRIDIDNSSKRYLINALFLDRKTKNVDGLFTAAIDAEDPQDIRVQFNPFSDALRATISRDSSLGDAFNFLTIKNLGHKKDGRFVIYAEEKSSMLVGPGNDDAPRPDQPSKWDTNPTVQPPTGINADVNPHLPAFNPSSGSILTRQSRIYHHSKIANFSNSIIIAEVDSLLNLTWNSVITKVQVGEEKYMSFGSYVEGPETHLLFTGFQTTWVINDYSVLNNGDFVKNNAIRILESDRKLMPRGLHQVGLQKAIIPATYRRKVVFALVDFSKPFKMIY